MGWSPRNSSSNFTNTTEIIKQCQRFIIFQVDFCRLVADNNYCSKHPIQSHISLLLEYEGSVVKKDLQRYLQSFFSQLVISVFIREITLISIVTILCHKKCYKTMKECRKYRNSNGERQAKKQRVLLAQSYKARLTFDKSYFRKDAIDNYISRQKQRMGYDYDSEDSQVLRKMQEQFESKMRSYLGGRAFTKKMDRFEKMQKKDELAFSRTKNPLVTVFGKIDRKARKYLLWEGLKALTSTK